MKILEAVTVSGHVGEGKQRICLHPQSPQRQEDMATVKD